MAYLKCNYGEGMFSDERFITFGIPYDGLFGGMFVNREDVVPYKEDGWNGLVKVVILEMDENKALVSVNDVGDKRLSMLLVPKGHILHLDKI